MEDKTSFLQLNLKSVNGTNCTLKELQHGFTECDEKLSLANW